MKLVDTDINTYFRTYAEIEHAVVVNTVPPMDANQPPFDIIAKNINQISTIAEHVGRLESRGLSASPQLRK